MNKIYSLVTLLTLTFFNVNAQVPKGMGSSDPAAKKIFHSCSFQLYFRNGIFAGKHNAHIWRSVLEMPSILFPANKSNGTDKPIMGPAIYHGH